MGQHGAFRAAVYGRIKNCSEIVRAPQGIVEIGRAGGATIG